MKLESDQLAPFITGADDGELLDGAWRALRIPAPMRPIYETNENQHARACSPAGVRLRFVTDARTVRLTLRYGNEARPVFRGALRVDRGEAQPIGPDEREATWTGAIFQQDQPAQHEFDLWLPHMVQTDLVALEADDATFLDPAEPLPLRWIAYGDSITQGMTASLPHRTVAARCAIELDAALYNWAIGGATLDPQLAETVPDVEADLVSIAYGTNDFNKGRTVEAYRDSAARLIEAASTQWPGRPIVLLTPLTWANRSEPNELGVMLPEYRSALKSVAASFEQVRLVAGDELMDDDPSLFVDNVHPNDAGFAQYAQRLLPELRVALGDRTAGRA